MDRLMKKKIQCLIVGAGRIAGRFEDPNSPGIYSHIKAIRRLSDTMCVSGIVDNNIEALRDYAEKWNVPAYDSIPIAIETIRPEIISICSSSNMHAENIIDILSGNNLPKVIVLEKPVCLNKKEYEQIKYLKDKLSVDIYVNHTRRYYRHLDSLKAAVSKLNLGKIIKLKFSYYGGWLTNAVHALDLITYLTNDRIRIDSITGTIESRYEHDPLFSAKGQLESSQIPIDIETANECDFQLMEMEIWYHNGRIFCKNFLNEVTLERVVVNDIGERELITKDTFLPITNDIPILNLYSRIEHQLLSENPIMKCLVTFDEIQDTMNTLFKGVELYDQYNKSKFSNKRRDTNKDSSLVRQCHN